MRDVLIVGAGPTGLVLALWLTRLGIRVRIVSKASGPGTTSRAMAVQARTLELYRQLDLTDAVIAAGHRNPAINLWAEGRRRARIGFGEAGATLTPYPFVLIYPQDQHERLLVERLQALGISVEWQTELLEVTEAGGQVGARLRGPDGSEETCAARALAGCDGARSLVRQEIGAGFPGETYRQIFYVADVEVRGLAPDGEIHLSLATSDFVALIAYGQGGRYRLIGTVRDDRIEDADHLTFDDVGHDAVAALGVGVAAVNWFSTYRVHHRVTDHFRRGRVFLLGDAAHVHSPVGGQGMNTGLGDAINLAWKLAAVLKGQAPDSLLDTYETERRAFARTLVGTTDRLFGVVTAEGRIANLVRTRIAPSLMGAAYRLAAVRKRLFRLVSQTALAYHDSPLSQGVAGHVRGGDRLPWVATGGTDNHAPLTAIAWQLHVYGIAAPELRDACASRNIPLHVFDWHSEHGRAGLARDAAYLLRPDTYVALADPHASAETLARYLDARGLMRPA